MIIFRFLTKSISFVYSCDVNVSTLDARKQRNDISSDEILRNLMYSLDTRNLTLRTPNGNQRSEQDVDDEIFASARISDRNRPDAASSMF